MGVLFVCLGNICRSPLAEGIFLSHARARRVSDLFDVDSCGTGGWHVGAPPDPRSIGVAAARSIVLNHLARRLDPPADFRRFSVILAMDRSNARDIAAAGETHGLVPPKIRLVLDRAGRQTPPHQLDVPDPYYGGADGFERVFEMLDTACAALVDELAADGRDPSNQ